MFTITVVVCDLFCLYYVYLQYICICIKFIIQCTFRSMGKDTLYIYILRIQTHISYSVSRAEQHTHIVRTYISTCMYM